MRYWVNELNVVRIKDIKTLFELKNFVRYPNGAWAAKPGAGNQDDRVMSLIWSLIILENEVTERYFEIAELDDNKRPLRLKSMDYGIKYFINPTSMYNNEKNPEEGNPMPMLFDIGDSPELTGINEMEEQGWKLMG